MRLSWGTAAPAASGRAAAALGTTDVGVVERQVAARCATRCEMRQALGTTCHGLICTLDEVRRNFAAAQRDERDARRRRFAAEKQRRLKLRGSKVHHARTWNPSIDPGRLIERPFVGLGPNPEDAGSGAPGTDLQDKSIWPVLPGRSNEAKVGCPRRSDEERNITRKAPWYAVTSGRLFGSDMSDFTPAQRARFEKLERDGIEAAERAAEEARRDKILMKAASSRRKPWTIGNATSRLLSDVKPDRPQTAHERALAQRMVSADRNQFKPNAGTKSRLSGTGSRARSWMPTNTMAHIFSQPSVHWHGEDRVVSVSPGPSMELSRSSAH